MNIEGTITERAKVGRMVCLQIANDRVFVEHEVFEDLGSLRAGVEVEVECFKNEQERLIATAVVVRCSEETTKQQLHDGLHTFQVTPSDAVEHGMTDRVSWRYRRPT